MIDFAKETTGMTAEEILNYYRNLYYKESSNTERGIVANAINEINRHRCTKQLNGAYSFYVKCTCGAEFNVDSFYWRQFKLCPSCGAKIIEGREEND